jgi:hypothetical protein
MALGKEVATTFGVSASYWKVANIIEDFMQSAAKVTLAGFVSQAARTAGNQPLAAVQVDLTGDSYTAEMDRAALYSAIKALPAWTGAEDC